MSAVQGHSPRNVARMLGTNVAQVYLVRHRVARLARQEKETVEADRIRHEQELRRKCEGGQTGR
jgi:hypothetical protein